MESGAVAQRLVSFIFITKDDLIRLTNSFTPSLYFFLPTLRRRLRQSPSFRVAGRVLSDNHGVIVVLRFAQYHRKYPVSGVQ